MKNNKLLFRASWILGIVTLLTQQCYSQDTLVASSGATNYQWYQDGNLIAGSNGQQYIANQPGVYFATLTQSSCSKSTEYYVLVDNCNNGDTVDLVLNLPDGNEVVTWSNGELGDSIRVISTNVVETYTANVLSDGGSCSTDIAFKVKNFSDYPIASIVAGGPVVFCDGLDVTLSTTSETGYSYQWQLNGVILNGETNSSINVGSTGFYSVVVTNQNGCVSSDTTEVTVNPLPDVVANVDLSEVCLGDAVLFTGTGAQSYVWNQNVNDGVSYTPTSIGITSYIVTGTDANGCENSDTIDVVVNQLPDVVANVDLSEVCLGDAVVFTGAGAQSYVWNQNVNDGVSYTPTSTGVASYIVTGTDANGCENSDTIDVMVNQLPEVVANVDLSEVCLGDAVVFTGTGAQSYVWNQNVNDGVSYTPTSVGITSYIVTGTDANGCENSDTIDVMVNQLPIVIGSVDNTNPDIDEPIIFTGSGASYYEWNNGVIDGVQFVPVGTGEISFVVVGTDQNGCENIDTVFITVSDQGIVVNGLLTPNGDGENDFWIIEGLQKYPDHVVQVFNRWGTKVFESKNYSNNWNGQINTNVVVVGEDQLPTGTYYYIIIPNELEVEPIKGYLYIKNL